MSIAARIAFALAAGLYIALSPVAGLAQAYPSKPIRFVVPFPPGGGTDNIARSVASRLSASIGQPVVVENRAGASGIIGTEAVARSAPDGYTVLIAGVGELTISPSLYKKLPYDPIKDFQPVSLIGINPMVMAVNPSVLAVSSLAELIQYAKSNPGKVNYGSYGPGSIAHVMMELLAHQAGLKLTHVPYKGSGPALQGLLGGQIGLMFIAPTVAKGQIEAGRIRGIAVSTKKRVPAVGAIPTIAEAGVEYEAFSWVAAQVPAGTSPDVVRRLNAEISKVVASPEIQKHFADQGILPAAGSTDEYSAFFRQEVQRWGDVVRSVGISLD